MTANRIFPAELVSAVINKLPEVTSNNSEPTLRSALRACSLVHRTWTVFAQELLFANLKCSFRRPPTDGTATNTPHKTLSMLADALQRLPPTVRGHVRRLTLQALPWAGSFTQADMVDPATLAAVLVQLPELRTLDLHNVVPAHLPPPASRIALPAACTLVVGYDAGASAVAAMPHRVLGCFANVAAVRLLGGAGGGTWPAFGDPVDGALTHLAVERLELRNMYVAPLGIFDQLARSPTVRTLKVLQLEEVGAGVLSALQELINCAGPSLRRLEFETMTTRLRGYERQRLDLTSCTGLKHIKLVIDIDPDDVGQQEDAVREVTAMFITIPRAPSLGSTTVEVLLGYTGSSDTASATWVRDRQMVSRPEFITAFENALLALVDRSSLSYVAIECVSDPDDGDEQLYTDVMKRWLPELHAQGKLRFV